MENIIEVIGAFNRFLLFEDPFDQFRRDLNAFLAKQPADERRPGVHVTDLLAPCFRKLMFKLLDPGYADIQVSGKDRKMFDCGTMTHWWWQNRYFGPMGILRGSWKCSVCDSRKDGFMPKEPCTSKLTIHYDNGGTLDVSCADLDTRWIYIEPEVSFTLNGIEVTGNTDGELVIRDNETILEMKSMRQDQFKDLHKAVSKDVIQSSSYAWARGIKLIMPLYINKTDWDFRPFLKKPDPRAIAWLDEQTRVLAMLLDTKDPMAAPPLCKSKDVSKAKRCWGRSKCFPSKRAAKAS